MDGAKSISAQYMFAVSLHVEMDENGISFEVEAPQSYLHRVIDPVPNFRSEIFAFSMFTLIPA